MVPNSAVGVKTTQTRTRILALAVDTGQVGRTFRVDDALRPAVGRRANHVWKAGAVTAGAVFPGRVGVRAAGVGDAGVLLNHGQDGWKHAVSHDHGTVRQESSTDKTLCTNILNFLF